MSEKVRAILTGSRRVPHAVAGALVLVLGLTGMASPAIADTAATPTVAPANSTAADLENARGLVTAMGFTPFPRTSWDRPGFNVILGTQIGYMEPRVSAFFFYDGDYLGRDTTTTSRDVQQLWSTSDVIALSYTLYNVDDAMCCPTAGAATVRFQWTGAEVVPLDPIPPVSGPGGERR